MTTFREILAAVVKKIKDNFPDIEIQTQDIEEGFKRPSFFVEATDVKISDFMTRYQEKNFRIRIAYFPTKPNKNQIELLEILDKLSVAFVEQNEVWLDEECCLVPENSDSAIVDRVLHFNFDLYLSEAYKKEEKAENMENIIIEISPKTEKEKIDYNFQFDLTGERFELEYETNKQEEEEK